MPDQTFFTQPSLFVPHGAPTFALRPGAAGAALAQKANQLDKPRAIVIVSAHWETDVPTIGVARRFDTIHDFWGFPDALYALTYPASGCPEAAAEVSAAVKAALLHVEHEHARGLDHGAWVPLRLMFPEADIPVISLSLPLKGGAEAAYRLGQALAPLREKGFLIIGSGSLTHNLRDYQHAWQSGGGTPPYVRQFADWIAERLDAGDLAALLAYRRLAPHAHQAHPTEEHLLPFFVALGAAGDTLVSERFHVGIDDVVIAMDAYAFGTPPVSV